MNSWYVITGSPSSGKSTLIAELQKLDFVTVPEAARTYIDDKLALGQSLDEIRKDEKAFQEEVMRLKQKIETGLDQNILTFFDRGVHDSLAYMRHYGFEVANWISELVEKATYQKVFLLEPLPSFEKDYARTEDNEFSYRLHSLLEDAYIEFGMKPIKIPAVSVDERLKLILSHVKQEQTV